MRVRDGGSGVRSRCSWKRNIPCARHSRNKNRTYSIHLLADVLCHVAQVIMEELDIVGPTAALCILGLQPSSIVSCSVLKMCILHFKTVNRAIMPN